MKKLIGFIIVLFATASLMAQPPLTSKGGSTSFSFINYQKSFSRPQEALKRKEDTLQKQFAAAGLKWPAK
ncbi:MAG TPA: hypothetical protein PLH49_13415, partial [Chitinophagaceae bacterium]|nr:hypothetical protein [Chitinophagaceae bacterium]